MEMGEGQKDSLSLKEFQDKCRICLKNHGDMADALASGISNTVMEVINIKITWDDELPKCICQDCRRQIETFYKFQSLAKDSDNYLRALLLAEKCFSKETGNEKMGISSEKKNKKFHKSYARKKFNCKYYDKMYLIHVDRGGGDFESQSEIYMKDLNSENDNLELTDFCKSLIQARSREPSHPAEQLEKNLTYDPDGNLMAESLCNSVFQGNWFIYQCNQCKETFQSGDCLSEHLKVSHGNEVSMTSISHTCRVCAKSMDDKNLFLEHLNTHTTEDLSLLKIDGTGECSSPDDLKKELLLVPKTFDHSIIKNRVYKVNESYYKCLLCQKLEPAESINEHLKVCFSDFEEEENYLTPHLKFACPACSTSWIDNCEDFKQHLLSHRENNVFFIKVNISGEPVDLTDEDFMFTPFEKALEALNFGEGESGVCTGSRIIKMRNLFSCQVCDFETTSVDSFSEHLEIDGPGRPIPCVCPVCREDFKFLDLREMSDFQRHMINHKQEGVCFLKVNADGSVVSDGSDGSGLFSDVNDLLHGRVQCPELEFMSSISVPLVYVERTGAREDGECLTQKKDIAVTRLKDFTKKENKCAREYICEKCGKECSGKGNYRKHFLTHGKDTEACSQKRPKCSVCDKTFSTRAILTEHKRHHSENEAETAEDSARTICEICGRGLPSNASLAKHRKLHARERDNAVLKCKICGRNFRRESALNRHLSAHLNPNYFECGECKLPLPSMASLERHKLGHQSSANTHDCSVCKVSFLTKDRLMAHETHTGHNQNRKRFECNVCHERFFIGREFTKHIKLHPKYKMSECALCGKRLSTMQSLMLHLDRHFESNSILCPHCGKQCFEERNYRRHLLTHKGEKPFACDVEGCDKSFYTYFEVKRHKKYHNNTRDFNCPYCPKSFHEANHLKVHIRTHTGERPYTCPHCNKSFVTRTRCKQHISLVHQGVGYDLIQSTISKKVAVFEAVGTPA